MSVVHTRFGWAVFAACVACAACGGDDDAHPPTVGHPGGASGVAGGAGHGRAGRGGGGNSVGHAGESGETGESGAGERGGGTQTGGAPTAGTTPTTGGSAAASTQGGREARDGGAGSLENAGAGGADEAGSSGAGTNDSGGGGGATGGINAGVGGTNAGVGGTNAGVGGTNAGVGGAGTGGLGASGTGPGTGGTSTGNGGGGAGGTDVGTGGTLGTTSGTGGVGAGTGGEAGSGGDGSCVGDACNCILVAPDGNDELASASGGLVPFANVQPAIDFADAHRSGPLDVCIANGAACSDTATYAGPNGAELTMRDGISVYGGYETTTWRPCSLTGVTLAPTTAPGIYFGPDITSATVLSHVIVARFPAATNAAITIDGAHGAEAYADVQTGGVGTGTSVAVDIRNDAEAKLGIYSWTYVQPTASTQIGVRVVDSKVIGSASLNFSNGGGSKIGFWLERAGGSSLGGNISIAPDVETIGVHAERSPGLVLGVHIDATWMASGFERGTGIELVDSPDATVTGYVAIHGIDMDSGILLDGSPRAAIDAEVHVSGQTGYPIGPYGMRVIGDATGTTLRGSVTASQSPRVAAIALESCQGAPVIDAAVDATAWGETGGAEGIRVSGDCAATIHSNVTMRAQASHQAQSIVGIHCLGASRCTIDESQVQIVGAFSLPGGGTIPAGIYTATGIVCDPGSCVSITNSQVSGLSAAGELRLSRYSGGGVVAPGATLIQGNVIDAGCTGSSGIGLVANGLIQNNLIRGPSCGGSFVVPISRGTGLGIGGDANVQSNSIWGGGALDGVPFGQVGCTSTGVAINGGGAVSFFGNSITYGACGSSAAISRDVCSPSGCGIVDPCNPSYSGCAELATCTSLPNGTICSACAPGYVDNAENGCVDIDECATGADGCTPPSTCHNTLGGFACDCPAGYTYDQSAKVCVDIDECLVDHGGCDARVTCTNTAGGRSCGDCPPRYTGDGTSGCVEIDECLTNHGGCDPLVTCSNSAGGPVCGACPSGYTGDGVNGCHAPCTPGHMGALCDITFTKLSARRLQTCGLRTDGAVRCWGDHDLGQSSPPPGSFVALSEGQTHGCGVQSDGSLVCWGYGYYAIPSGTNFVEVATSYDHSCAIRAGGSVVCWGDTTGGKASPPGDALGFVAVGAWHTCGIRANVATVACWGHDGENDVGQADPPDGSFLALDVNLATSCGVTAAGALACWGAESFGGATLPAGPFTKLAIGANFGCAVRASGSLECWGADNVGQATPPAGTFLDVTAGDAHACALRSDHEVLCWGDDTFGESTPPAGGT